MKKNKTVKYIKYAIGEIILVVIGILIALTINNWNSNRIEILKYRKQLLKVTENIKSDSVQLEQLKQARLMMIDKTSQMIQELEDRDIINPDTFLNSFMILTGETKFVSDMDNELGSQFENYHDVHIHDLLDDYVKLSEKVKFREYRHNEFSENMELELWSKGFFHAISPKINKNLANNSYYTSFNKLDLEKMGIYDNETLFGLCLRAEYGFTLLISEYDQVIEKGGELTLAINRYLNDD